MATTIHQRHKEKRYTILMVFASAPVIYAQSRPHQEHNENYWVKRLCFFKKCVENSTANAAQTRELELRVTSRKLGFMLWSPVALLINGAFIMSHAEYKPTASALWVYILNHYTTGRCKGKGNGWRVTWCNEFLEIVGEVYTKVDGNKSPMVECLLRNL